MTRAARRDDWQIEPFAELEPIPYRASFSAQEFARIKDGLVPAEMEEKWFIFFEMPSLFLHRSWSGKGIFKIEFEPEGDGARATQAFCTLGPLGAEQSGYQSKLLSFLVSNLLLGRSEPFPVPEGEPNPAVAQHVVAGTGYPSIAVRLGPKRRWWKFWD
jgi:hypothetical protein